MLRKFGQMVCILALAALVGCGKSTLSQGGADSTQANAEKPVQKTETTAPNPTAGNDGTGERDDTSSEKSGTKEPDSTPLFKKFIKKKGLGANLELFFFEKEDLDRDGLEEAVVAYGPSEDDLTDIYVLKNRDGQIVQLGDNLNSGGYSVEGIKLIQLEGRDDKVIFLGLTNWASMTGFSLYDLEGGIPENIAYSASATGAGEDVLLDTDNNGRFDCYEQRRYSYDVLYYEVTRTYKLQKGEFIHADTSVNLPDYPASPEEVVEEYLALGIIDEQPPQNVASRRAELCRYCSKNPDKAGPQVDYSVMQNLILDLEEEGSALDVKEDDTDATATLKWKDENGRQHKAAFRLTKEGTGDSGKWTITDISSS